MAESTPVDLKPLSTWRGDCVASISVECFPWRQNTCCAAQRGVSHFAFQRKVLGDERLWSHALVQGRPRFTVVLFLRNFQSSQRCVKFDSCRSVLIFSSVILVRMLGKAPIPQFVVANRGDFNRTWWACIFKHKIFPICRLHHSFRFMPFQ